MRATVFSGATLFDLKAERGLPIDFTIDRLLEAGVRAVDWPSFIERARACGWYDFQTFRELKHALEDSSLLPTVRTKILDGFKRYVLARPME